MLKHVIPHGRQGVKLIREEATVKMVRIYCVFFELFSEDSVQLARSIQRELECFLNILESLRTSSQGLESVTKRKSKELSAGGGTSYKSTTGGGRINGCPKCTFSMFDKMVDYDVRRLTKLQLLFGIIRAII